MLHNDHIKCEGGGPQAGNCRVVPLDRTVSEGMEDLSIAIHVSQSLAGLHCGYGGFTSIAILRRCRSYTV